MALLADRTASLKWSGDYTLPRYRAKLANQYFLHPNVAPGYEELYRSDLGERTISRRDNAASSSDFAQSLRTNAGSPLGGTMGTQLGSSMGTQLGGTMLPSSSLTALGRSSSGAGLAAMIDASGTSLGLGRSSSVP